MSRLVRIVAVLAVLIGQLAASAQAPGDCHDTVSSHESAEAEHARHAHHGAGDHGEETEAPDYSGDPAPCHCTGSSHCGQLAALTTGFTPASGAPVGDSPYPAAVLHRPTLAHRRALDRPPA